MSETTAATLHELLTARAAMAPQALALLAPGRQPLTYAALLAQLQATQARLNMLGLGRQDAVALVLPNGPEMATAFLATSAALTCAPLNPAYRASEFEFYLADLQARAVIVPAGSDSPVVDVARQMGIAVLELAAAGPAGTFELYGQPRPLRARGGLAEPSDVALALHTSGTTARPKLVPLTQRNLAASSAHIRGALALTPHDRCLNVMPLFHIHGLLAALCASLSAGASLVATPGFDAPHFFQWLVEFQPTWYTAVPTMHQAILARAPEHPAAVAASPLRFIRSSSASLPAQVMAALEQTLHAPVVEAYGMTEAAHQMASNPLPPRARKPRSVGLAAGPEVAIMTEAGPALLPAGAVGEIVIRGPNVTAGYANNSEANARAFSHGWFRTGDQGYLDGDQYLFITGRLKELINRGGEKIAPGAVEEALLDHPAVEQAVAFAVPDARLGEAVAAAVVLRPGASLHETELRRFVALRLADFKVPQRVLILDDLPKGPTGKLQRLGLAEKLALAVTPHRPAAEYAPPENEIEELLAELWQSLLLRERVGRHDRFLDLGGDSLLAAQLLARVGQGFGLHLTLFEFFEAATIREQAELIERYLLPPLDVPADVC